MRTERGDARISRELFPATAPIWHYGWDRTLGHRLTQRPRWESSRARMICGIAWSATQQGSPATCSRWLPGVQCQRCHPGADEHARGMGTRPFNPGKAFPSRAGSVLRQLSSSKAARRRCSAGESSISATPVNEEPLFRIWKARLHHLPSGTSGCSPERSRFLQREVPRLSRQPSFSCRSKDGKETASVAICRMCSCTRR